MSESPKDSREGHEQVAPEEGSGATEVEAEVEVLDDGGDEATETAGGGNGAEQESEVEALRRERDEYLDLAQRARAELENYRRRMSGETRSAEQRGRAAVARDLLPALDNLERALTAAGVDPEGAAPSGEPASEEVSAHTALAEGVALVYRELRAGLQKAGVESFDPTGERFDPATSEAVSTAPADGVEPGAVVEVLSKGYRIDEQVLRPARVVVSG